LIKTPLIYSVSYFNLVRQQVHWHSGPTQLARKDVTATGS